MKQPITILIADDHEVVRTGLATVIEYEDGMKVVGVAKNGQLAVRLAAELHPTVIVMDLVMPVMGGVEATKRIREVSPKSHVLILTSFGTPDDFVTVHMTALERIPDFVPFRTKSNSTDGHYDLVCDISPRVMAMFENSVRKANGDEPVPVPKRTFSVRYRRMDEGFVEIEADSASDAIERAKSGEVDGVWLQSDPDHACGDWDFDVVD